jgi:histidyl-tRNA synthetase
VIEPRTLRGFRDIPPELAERRDAALRTITEVYASFGFRPIATPALEYLEILRGKGGEEQDRQMFSFTDQGGREVGMRFDLTVPLARFVAQHRGELELPLRCYQVGPVWRGERPQKGRYREFVQCDADLVGVMHPAADAEVLTMFHAALTALDVGGVLLRVNDRRILNGALRVVGVADRRTEALRALDKFDKVGAEGVAAELADLGIGAVAAERLAALPTLRGADDQATFAALADLVADDEDGSAGVASLRRVRELLAAAGVPDADVAVDPAIARGLDYYTGTVFETTYLPDPEVGSICSGGRYDDLTLVYSDQRAPGVGGSIGIDRLLAAMGDRVPGGRRPAPLVVVAHVAEHLEAAVRLAASLRAAGLRAEVYPEERGAKGQRRYAQRRGAQGLVTFAAGDDGDGPASEPVVVRVADLRGGGRDVAVHEAPAALVELLARPDDALG